MISNGTLYTFSLATDEAHFEAYRLDFEEMLASAVFTPPETGLQRLPGGYWMQRDFRFALRLPPGWKPAFGPDDKALFFATGEAHDVFTDNLLVLAGPIRALDLQLLKETLPSEIVKADEHAKVTCTIVPQGAAFALETDRPHRAWLAKYHHDRAALSHAAAHLRGKVHLRCRRLQATRSRAAKIAR